MPIWCRSDVALCVNLVRCLVYCVRILCLLYLRYGRWCSVVCSWVMLVLGGVVPPRPCRNGTFVIPLVTVVVKLCCVDVEWEPKVCDICTWVMALMVRSKLPIDRCWIPWLRARIAGCVGVLSGFIFGLRMMVGLRCCFREIMTMLLIPNVVSDSVILVCCVLRVFWASLCLCLDNLRCNCVHLMKLFRR